MDERFVRLMRVVVVERLGRLVVSGVRFVLTEVVRRGRGVGSVE